jgi:hypothetical protein
MPAAVRLPQAWHPSIHVRRSAHGWRLAVAAVLTVLALGGPHAWADAPVPTVEQLEQAARDNPSAAARQNLAEGYLRDCQLEKSLKLWQELVKADPTNERAKQVVSRLTTQALDLDGHLAVLETLIDKSAACWTPPASGPPRRRRRRQSFTCAAGWPR